MSLYLTLALAAGLLLVAGILVWREKRRRARQLAEQRVAEMRSVNEATFLHDSHPTFPHYCNLPSFRNDMVQAPKSPAIGPTLEPVPPTIVTRTDSGEDVLGILAGLAVGTAMFSAGASASEPRPAFSGEGGEASGAGATGSWSTTDTSSCSSDSSYSDSGSSCSDSSSI